MGAGQSVTDDCADFAVADPPVPKPYTCAMLLRFAWRAPTTGLLKTVPALLYHFTRAAHLCRWLDDSGIAVCPFERELFARNLSRDGRRKRLDKHKVTRRFVGRHARPTVFI